MDRDAQSRDAHCKPGPLLDIQQLELDCYGMSKESESDGGRSA